jgi:uridine kinase
MRLDGPATEPLSILFSEAGISLGTLLQSCAQSQLIVLGGKSRAGKTSLSKLIQEGLLRLGREVVVMCLDDYLGGPGYVKAVGQPNGSIPIEEELSLKFSYIRIEEDVGRLLAGEPVYLPVYSRKYRTRLQERADRPLIARQGLLVEGTPALALEALKAKPSTRIYLDADSKERETLLMRDWMESKGLPLAQAKILLRYRKEREEPFIATGRYSADFMVQRTGSAYLATKLAD